MTPPLAASHRWVADGTALCREALVDAELDKPSLLPGWSRKHLLAHLSLNAEALGNLVHWARTGEERPMYGSPEQRNDDIEANASRPVAELLAWFDESAQTLTDAMTELTDEQWRAPVLNTQGRQILATAVPWMRSREVMIHAVDLGVGVTFPDLPSDFLEALTEDIRTTRGDVPELIGPLPQIAAYLAGRSYDGVLTVEGTPAEPLPRWL
jgi:maleylpyruvate isomerase